MLQITVPKDFPFCPPAFQFETVIWHPNINFISGFVGLDCLQPKMWHPGWTLHALLVSIEALLNDPIVDDAPSNTEAAPEFQHHHAFFRRKAEHLISMHHGGSDSQINGFTEMGFEKDSVIVALKICNWDEGVTLHYLLAHGVFSDDEYQVEDENGIGEAELTEAALAAHGSEGPTIIAPADIPSGTALAWSFVADEHELMDCYGSNQVGEEDRMRLWEMV